MIVETVAQMIISAIPKLFWFGGLVKFGCTPGGGRRAGPSSIAFCQMGGRLARSNGMMTTVVDASVGRCNYD